MLEEEAVAPSAAARAALDAARREVERLRGKQQTLPERHAAAVQAGNFEAASAAKAEEAGIEDRINFGRQQVRIAEEALLRAELHDAEHDAREAVPVLEAAFAAHTRAQMALDDAAAAVRAAQVRMGAAQARVQSLQQRQSDLLRHSNGKDEPA